MNLAFHRFFEWEKSAAAAPLPEQLWIQSESRECLAFFPGDEHVSFELRLPEPSLWRRYEIRPFDPTGPKIVTPFGECQLGNSRLLDCCERLGLKPVENSEARGWVVGHRIAAAQVPPHASSAPLVPERPALVGRSPWGWTSSLLLVVLVVGLVRLVLFLRRNGKRKWVLFLPLGVLGGAYTWTGFVMGFRHGDGSIANRDTLAPVLFGAAWGLGGAMVGSLGSSLLSFLVLRSASTRAALAWLGIGTLPLVLLGLRSLKWV